MHPTRRCIALTATLSALAPAALAHPSATPHLHLAGGRIDAATVLVAVLVAAALALVAMRPRRQDRRPQGVVQLVPAARRQRRDSR